MAVKLTKSVTHLILYYNEENLSGGHGHASLDSGWR